MSSYHNGAHRGISISKYINNLNETEPVETQELDDSPFALFTNVGEFADVGNYPIDSTLDFNFGTEENQPAQAITPNVADKMDFPLNGDFQFTDFSTNFANPILDNSGLSNLPQNAQSNNFALPQQQQQQQNYSSPVSALSPAVPSFDASLGKKRKLGEHGEATSQQAIDEAARLAAEEDKRRRNTAASARFRVKKKQREQTLEKTAKEMSERVNLLEARIQQLETENTWLKGLITEKNGGKTSTSEIRAMLSKREEDNNNKSASERSSGTRTDGVGTKA